MTMEAEQAANPVGWLAEAGLRLQPEEAALFLEAARLLLPAELDLEGTLRAGGRPTEAQGLALRKLWLRTGAPPPAPIPMPLQPLAPGVLGAAWRRLREALSRSPRAEAG